MNNDNKKYGLDITGNIRVFRKDKEIEGKGKKTFTVTDVWFNVSEKEDDQWVNKSMKLLFKRDLNPPENNTVIEITKAFPVLTGDGKYRQIALMVLDYEPEVPL